MKRQLGEYVRMSTANPTGWRPWNSRLGYYLPNSYPLPTTGRGPFLLQPGQPCVRPSANGGLGDSTISIFGLQFEPITLALGLVALLGAVYLMGSGRPKRRRARLRRRISRAQQQLRAIEA